MTRGMRLLSARSAFARSIALNSPEAGLLTRRSSLEPAGLPIPKKSGCCAGRSLLTVAWTVRDLHPLPFSLASTTTSTSGSSQTSTSFPVWSIAPLQLLQLLQLHTRIAKKTSVNDHR